MLRKTFGLLLLIFLAAFQVLANDGVVDPGIQEAANFIRSEASSHRLILLGEMHGTREAPQLVGELMAAYSSQGPVVLGLEVPHSEQGAIDRYLASDGNAAARVALRSTPFWQVEGVQHDGRRNFDALDLIERVRSLRAQGLDVSMLPFDDAPGSAGGSQARDKSMAARLRIALADLPSGRLLVLSGNVHAMLERPSDAPAEMQTPMGSYLRDLDPYSVNISARTGEFWVCMEHCGPVAMQATQSVSRRLDDSVYNLEIVLPRFTVARLIGATPGP